jgi:hypothetical protein
MFHGRREIREEVLNGGRNGASFAIIGGTRIGKTSLLFQIRHALLEQLKGPQNTVIGPVFLSTHEFPRLSQTVIYRRVVEEFRTTLAIGGSDEAWRSGVRLFDDKLTEDEAFGAFRQALETIFQSREVDRRIVIMIDEVDELSRYEWSHSFFNNLRHLISQTSAGERIAVIIAGTLAIRSLYEVAGSPFLNVIQGTKTLDLLSRAETEELVGRPTGYRLDPALVRSIFFETGGHPFLVQYLMKHLHDQFEAGLDKATERDLDVIVERYFDERTDFETWVHDFTDAEQRIYDIVVKNREGATRAEMVRALGDPKQVNYAIKMLVHIGVVREERPNSNRYVVGGDMFRRWFYETFVPSKSGPTPTPPPKGQPDDDTRVRLFKVFVASPGDVQEERQAIEPVVDEINQTMGRQLRLRLDVVRWETDAYPGFAAGGPQAVIDGQLPVEDCDVVIGIFWRRLGTPTPRAASGSASEIERACEAALTRRKPHVMVYFSDRPAAPRTLDEIDQWRKVVEFRTKVEKAGLCIAYTTVPDFAAHVRRHLTTFLQDQVAASR